MLIFVHFNAEHLMFVLIKMAYEDKDDDVEGFFLSPLKKKNNNNLFVQFYPE